MTKEHCLDHSGCVARITNLEEDGKTMARDISSAHRRMDGMKNWVIAGMTSLVLQLIVMIIGLTLVWAKTKGLP
jgi:hypothetical protein